MPELAAAYAKTPMGLRKKPSVETQINELSAK